MSDEFEMVQAMKQLAAVNAASVVQRQNEMALAQAEAAQRDKKQAKASDEATEFHYKINALKFAVTLNQNRSTAAQVVTQDADTFLAWLREGEKDHAG